MVAPLGMMMVAFGMHVNPPSSSLLPRNAFILVPIPSILTLMYASMYLLENYHIMVTFVLRRATYQQFLTSKIYGLNQVTPT